MIGNDLTTQAIEWALKGLERRSQVSANNIANAETPGFRASAVDFESQLRSALGAGRIERIADPTLSPTATPITVNGNNVRLEDELVGMIQTNLRKSAMIEAFNYKAGLLRTALRTQ